MKIIKLSSQKVILYSHLCIPVRFLRNINSPQQPEMTYEIGSVSPSVLLCALSSVSPGVFLEFSKVWHGSRNPFEVVHHRAKFLEKLFMLPKWAKKGFLFKLLVNLVIHFFLICSIICSVVKLYPITIFSRIEAAFKYKPPSNTSRR